MVELITRREQLEELREEWENLYDRAGRPGPFLRPTWLLAWLEAYASDLELACVAIRSEDRLVALAPLFVSRNSGVRILRLLGDGRLDYLGFLVAEQEPDAWAMLGRALSEYGRWDAIDLRSWCLPSLPKEFIDNLAPRALTTRTFERCPAVEISIPYEEFLKGKSSKFRKWLRQIERQANAHGVPEIRFVDTASFSNEYIGVLVALEKRGRHWSEGTAHFQDPRFEALIEGALRRDTCGLQLLILELAGSPISAELLVANEDAIYGLWTAYDSQFDGAGSFIVNEAIRSAFDRGYHRFDFMQGDQTYKKWWATCITEVQQIVIARTALGRIWMEFLRLRWSLSEQHWARRLRARLVQIRRPFQPRRV